MHPGEQHIRGEMMTAIHDHFNDLAITVDGVPYAVEIYSEGAHGSAVTVTHPSGEVVAQYRLKVSAEKVSAPKVAPVPEPVIPTPAPEPTPPASPSWSDGAWREVASGCLVIDEAGKVWEVTRQDTRTVTITCGDESYTFTPGADDAVKYSPRSEGV